MPDLLAGQDPTSDASAAAPVLSAADIETIKAELSADFDKRVAGLQRIISAREERATALELELEELKTAGMSDDEREQLQSQKLLAENAQLKARLELQELAGAYGDEMPYFQRLLAAPTAEDQLKAMREYRAASAAPAAAATPEVPVVEVPDVDPNRPARATTYSGQLMPDGSMMDEASADLILQGFGKNPLAKATQNRLVPTR